mmetsp:Transcript_33965/g.79429  ORF Transcript_33965/g.79429 Transcript_33965/m.79429 type:complete len:204 (-) Transcript_33965:1940-2551(-)
METNFLAEECHKERHTQTLRHSFPKNREATLLDCGSDEVCNSDNHEDDANHLHVFLDFIFGCTEVVQCLNHCPCAHRHRGSIHHRAKEGWNQVRPLGLAIGHDPAHGHFVFLRHQLHALFLLSFLIHAVMSATTGLPGERSTALSWFTSGSCRWVRLYSSRVVVRSLRIIILTCHLLGCSQSVICALQGNQLLVRTRLHNNSS